MNTKYWKSIFNGLLTKIFLIHMVSCFFFTFLHMIKLTMYNVYWLYTVLNSGFLPKSKEVYERQRNPTLLRNHMYFLRENYLTTCFLNISYYTILYFDFYKKKLKYLCLILETILNQWKTVTNKWLKMISPSPLLNRFY